EGRDSMNLPSTKVSWAAVGGGGSLVPRGSGGGG
nr:Chain C, Orexin [Homo sapiens]